MAEDLTPGEQLAYDFDQPGDRSSRFECLIELALTTPQELEHLIRFALANPPKFPRFVDVALDFLLPGAFPHLVLAAVESLKNNPENEVARLIVDGAALQFPGTVLPYLEVLSDLIPNQWSGKYEPYDGLDYGVEQRALVHIASQSRVYHLIFEPGYFTNASESSQLWLDHHPTWTLPVERALLAPIGGTHSNTCCRCGNPLHHIITLDPIPEGLGITNLPKLTLAVCLSCVGWELWCEEGMFYQHDSQGNPQHIPEVDYDSWIAPKFPATPLKSAHVHLAETPQRWYFQGWNSLQNINHIGGCPCWVQDEQYPGCPECGQEMAFLIQLDSNLRKLTTKNGPGVVVAWDMGFGVIRARSVDFSGNALNLKFFPSPQHFYCHLCVVWGSV